MTDKHIIQNGLAVKDSDGSALIETYDTYTKIGDTYLVPGDTSAPGTLGFVNALNAIDVPSVAGATIMLGGGFHQIDATLGTLEGLGVTIIGTGASQGAGNTGTIVYFNHATERLGFAGSNCHIHIKGVLFQCLAGSPGMTGSSAAINLGGSHQSVIEDCVFEVDSGSVIDANAGGNFIFRNLTFRTKFPANSMFYLPGCFNVEISNCFVDSCDTTHRFVWLNNSGDDFTIRNNILDFSTVLTNTVCIDFGGTSTGWLVDGNRITLPTITASNGGRVIDATSASGSDHRITNNTITALQDTDRYTTPMVRLRHSNTIFEGNTLNTNYREYNATGSPTSGSSSVLQVDGSNTQVLNNILIGSTDDSTITTTGSRSIIVIDGAASDSLNVNVRGNVIKGFHCSGSTPDAYGIYALNGVSNSADNCVISDNYFIGGSTSTDHVIGSGTNQHHDGWMLNNNRAEVVADIIEDVTYFDNYVLTSNIIDGQSVKNTSDQSVSYNDTYYVLGASSSPGTTGLATLIADMSSNTYGGTIILGNGYHDINFTSDTPLNDCVHIVGSGVDTTGSILYFSADNAANRLRLLDSGSVIENVRFDGVASTANRLNVLSIEESQCIVRNCYFDVGAKVTAVGSIISISSSGTHTLIENCSFPQNDCYYGLTISGPYTTIRNCEFGDVTNEALYRNSAINLVADNTSIEKCSWFGQPNSDGNNSFNEFLGIATSAQYCKILDNALTLGVETSGIGNSRFIDIASNATNSGDHIISRNKFVNKQTADYCQASGIFVGQPRCIISDNIFECDFYGYDDNADDLNNSMICTDSNGSYCSIIGNSGTTNNTTILHVTSQSNDGTFSNNRFISCAWHVADAQLNDDCGAIVLGPGASDAVYGWSIIGNNIEYENDDAGNHASYNSAFTSRGTLYNSTFVGNVMDITVTHANAYHILSGSMTNCTFIGNQSRSTNGSLFDGNGTTPQFGTSGTTAGGANNDL